ncbi:hypothetical protein HKD37_11G031978 [Glycine soja]
MDEDQWTYDYTMSQEVYMDYDNEEEYGVNEPHVDCSNAFNTCQVFGTQDDILQWARTVAHENGFVAVIMRNKEFVRRDTGSRKYGCPFRLHGKPVHGGEGWMVKLICGIHNHELAKSLEHNANSCTTIKQIYNARSAYRSSIRGADTEMQHLMKLFERDQYIHWHRLKDEVVVRDLFWCHPDAVKLCNACHLVFFIDSTYKTNRYKLPLLDFYLVCISGGNDRLPVVIVTDRDLALMNAVKTMFLECTNLLCRFHIDKNVKAKCKSLIDQKNAWDYLMDNWGTLVDCPSEQQFVESLQKFQIACSPWPMFVDYALKRVLQNSLGDLCSVWDAMNNMITLQHVEIKASFETNTHVVGHVFKKTLYKRLVGMVLRNTLNEIVGKVERLRYLDNNPSSCGCVMRSTFGLPCACKLSRYTTGSIPLDSVHMSWRRLCFSDQGLCEVEDSIKEEIETISERFEELDVCGKLTLKNIAYPDHNSMCPPPSKVNTKGAPKKPMKRSQRSTKPDPSYLEYVDAFHSVQSSNSSVKHSASSSEPPKPTRIIPMLDQFAPFRQDFIHNIVDVKADGMGEDSWSLVRNKLIKELDRWSHDYNNLFGGTKRFEQLRLSLLVDGFSKVSVDKWMDITEMGYVIASRYNVILVSLSRKQSMTFFPLRSQPPPDSSVHRMICVGHMFENHFVQLIMFVHAQQVYLKDRCPLPPLALLWSTNYYSQAKQWPTLYISRMQQYTSLIGVYFQTSTPVPIRVPNSYDFASLKTRIHNTLQLTDK